MLFKKIKKIKYMFKNKIFHIIAIIFIFICTFSKVLKSSEVNCVNIESNIECNYKIEVNSKNTSDLGTYNISILLSKIKKINGVFNGKMSINSGLCGTKLITVLEENMQIAQANNNHGYNFPLYLHRKKIEADFCVKIMVKNCIDSCGELISLSAQLSPIMQMQGR